jgi:hypothetical protein
MNKRTKIILFFVCLLVFGGTVAAVVLSGNSDDEPKNTTNSSGSGDTTNSSGSGDTTNSSGSGDTTNSSGSGDTTAASTSSSNECPVLAADTTIEPRTIDGCCTGFECNKTYVGKYGQDVACNYGKAAADAADTTWSGSSGTWDAVDGSGNYLCQPGDPLYTNTKCPVLAANTTIEPRTIDGCCTAFECNKTYVGKDDKVVSCNYGKAAADADADPETTWAPGPSASGTWDAVDGSGNYLCQPGDPLYTS